LTLPRRTRRRDDSSLLFDISYVICDDSNFIRRSFRLFWSKGG
jgi:hypothetical protein